MFPGFRMARQRGYSIPVRLHRMMDRGNGGDGVFVTYDVRQPME